MSQFNDNPYYPHGGAGGGGGGYLAGGSPFSTSGSPGGLNRRSEASHSLRPLTISQIIKATQAHTDAEWMIDDAEIGQVTIVAQVISIQSQTTNSVYWLDDGSGRIEARHWVDTTSEVDSGKWSGISENAYVRTTGALKTFGSKRYINVVHIRLVKDAHELYFHLLETMTTNLIFERGPPVGPGQPGNSGQAVHTAYSTQTQSTAATTDIFAGLPPIQRSIINFIGSQPPNDEGVHVAAIARTIGGDAHHISNALETLMEEGLVYTTIDDSHFKLSR